VSQSDLDARSSWLSHDELESTRARVPIVYVEAVPVRVDDLGRVTSVGLLLRQTPDGRIARALVSGRVMYGERVRDALMRHMEKDLGPMALPHIPVTPVPFSVVEYFPDATVTGYHDPRQHAVALAFVVPVAGDCSPSQESLDLAWFTPHEAAGDGVALDMSGGQDRVLRLALAHAGALP
jgi:ADP-ribose pyrophosphatase YjhB (NUDIX family)